MPAAPWWREVLQRVVLTFQANSDLAPTTGLCGKIEAGITDALRDQDIMGFEMPYAGVSSRTFPDDDTHEAPVPFSSHAIEVLVGIATLNRSQLAAEQSAMDIIATIALAVGHEKTRQKFSLTSAYGRIEDVLVGGGGLTEIGKSKDDATFLVLAEYRFRIIYWLQLA